MNSSEYLIKDFLNNELVIDGKNYKYSEIEKIKRDFSGETSKNIFMEDAPETFEIQGEHIIGSEKGFRASFITLELEENKDIRGITFFISDAASLINELKNNKNVLYADEYDGPSILDEKAIDFRITPNKKISIIANAVYLCIKDDYEEKKKVREERKAKLKKETGERSIIVSSDGTVSREGSEFELDLFVDVFNCLDTDVFDIRFAFENFEKNVRKESACYKYWQEFKNLYTWETAKEHPASWITNKVLDEQGLSFNEKSPAQKIQNTHKVAEYIQDLANKGENELADCLSWVIMMSSLKNRK